MIDKITLLSKNNIHLIKHDTLCGCYYCLKVTKGNEIVNFADNGTTAVCPHCSVDSVLPNVTDEKYLKKIHKKWFEND